MFKALFQTFSNYLKNGEIFLVFKGIQVLSGRKATFKPQTV